jgi:hypothetical protein
MSALCDAKTTIEDGDLVLRVPLTNVIGAESDWERGKGTRYELKLFNQQTLLVDREAYESVVAWMAAKGRAGSRKVQQVVEISEGADLREVLTGERRPYKATATLDAVVTLTVHPDSTASGVIGDQTFGIVVTNGAFVWSGVDGTPSSAATWDAAVSELRGHLKERGYVLRVVDDV